MKTIDLQKIQHNVKQGDVCGDLLPNIKESCLLVEDKKGVQQYSALLGSIPPKPHMRRHHANYAAVHSEKTAQLFIRAMLGLAKESEALIKQYMPEQYNYLHEQCSKNIDKK